jgi:hypothetical protein
MNKIFILTLLFLSSYVGCDEDQYKIYYEKTKRCIDFIFNSQSKNGLNIGKERLEPSLLKENRNYLYFKYGYIISQNFFDILSETKIKELSSSLVNINFSYPEVMRKKLFVYEFVKFLQQKVSGNNSRQRRAPFYGKSFCEYIMNLFGLSIDNCG